MIKVKMIELLNIITILNKLCNINDEKINIQFKFKIAMLNEELIKYTTQYSKAIQQIIKDNEIKIIDNQFVNKDKNKLNNFLKSKAELENMDLEINQVKIIFDKNINNISANELLILKPFFDYSEIM